MTVFHKTIRLVCISEVMIVLGIFIFGSHGIHTYRGLKKENGDLQVDIATLKQDLEKLHEEEILWQSYAEFYYEQLAREKLHMAYKDDIVYFTS
jgi:cell division protein FtsB